MHDVQDPVLGIDLGGVLFVEVFVGERPTTYTIDRVGIEYTTISTISLELHTIGMEGENNIGLPNDLCRSYRCERL